MSLNKSVESRGIVAFAVNSGTIDYVSIAHKTLSLASKTLNLPYTLITEDMISEYIKLNMRHDADTGKFIEWKNMGRNSAYKLSPYDETLVIDVDYVVQDDSLLKIFELPWDYILMRDARSLNDEYMPNIMGSHSLPYVWATVFAFRKTLRSEMFFDLVTRIQNNYHYYRELFNAESRAYRNDYAFAMADIILNGYQVGTASIPGPMLNITQTINSIDIQDNKLIVKDSTNAYVIPQMNMHIMSKQYLQSDDFNQFIKNATA